LIALPCLALPCLAFPDRTPIEANSRKSSHSIKHEIQVSGQLNLTTNRASREDESDTIASPPPWKWKKQQVNMKRKESIALRIHHKITSIKT
jgi:hypothetical protein